PLGRREAAPPLQAGDELGPRHPVDERIDADGRPRSRVWRAVDDAHADVRENVVGKTPPPARGAEAPRYVLRFAPVTRATVGPEPSGCFNSAAVAAAPAGSATIPSRDSSSAIASSNSCSVTVTTSSTSSRIAVTFDARGRRPASP